jgi:hypothetical protein
MTILQVFNDRTQKNLNKVSTQCCIVVILLLLLLQNHKKLTARLLLLRTFNIVKISIQNCEIKLK